MVVELKRINAPTSLGWVYMFDEFLNTQHNHMKQQFDKASYRLRNRLTNHHINLKGNAMSQKTSSNKAAIPASSLPFFVLLSPNLAILSPPF